MIHGYHDGQRDKTVQTVGVPKAMSRDGGLIGVMFAERKDKTFTKKGRKFVANGIS